MLTEKPDSRNRSVAAILTAAIAAAVVGKGVRIDPSIAERLRAMGYLR